MTETNEINQNDHNRSKETDDGFESMFENPVIKFFRGFPNVSEETVQNISESDIMHKDLSALCDKDLELFGIKNAETRREMVVKLVNLPNQMVHFEKFIEEMDPAKYEASVYKSVLRQLRLIHMVLEASQKTLKANPIKCDKLVDDNVYISTLNTKTLKEILKVVSYITGTSISNQSFNWLCSIAALTGIALFSSFYIFSKLR